MKSSLSQFQIKKKNSPVKNTVHLLLAVAIGVAAYLIYVSGNSTSLKAELGGAQESLSLKTIDWNETFFSTPAFKELKVSNIGVGEIGQLGNPNPFERLKKE